MKGPEFSLYDPKRFLLCNVLCLDLLALKYGALRRSLLVLNDFDEKRFYATFWVVFQGALFFVPVGFFQLTLFTE